MQSDGGFFEGSIAALTWKQENRRRRVASEVSVLISDRVYCLKGGYDILYSVLLDAVMENLFVFKLS